MARTTPVNSGYHIINGTSTGINASYTDCWLEWSIISQDINANTSNVRVILYAASRKTSTTSWIYEENFGYVGYDGDNKQYKSTSYNFADYAVNCFGDYTFTILHNNDGTKSVTLEGEWSTSHSTYISGGSVSGVVVLTTIPRQSSIISLTPSVAINGSNAVDVNIYKNNSNFTHTVEFYIDSAYTEMVYDVDTLVSYAIPISWLSAMPSSTSCIAYCTVTTYSDGIQIGNPVTESFIVTVPSDVVPQITTDNIILDPEDINGNNILVQGKNGIIVSVSGCSAGMGSSIKSYTFTSPSGAYTTTTSTSATFGAASSSGVKTYTVTVTDNRGRSASADKTIQCHEYVSPYFNSFVTYRSNSDGTANNNGTCITCSYSLGFSVVDNTNDVTVVLYYKKGLDEYLSKDILVDSTETSGDYILDSTDVNSAYTVYATIVDNYGGKGSSDATIVFGAERILNITQDGKGFAIGKISEKTEEHTNGLFECKWDAQFYGDLECNNMTADTISCTKLSIDNLNCTSIGTDTLTSGEATLTKVNCDEITIQQKTIFDLIYPVGSIYISANSTSPQALFGGTWTQLENRFLLGAGSDYTAGATGGSATHTLTEAQLPSHNHDGIYYTNTSGTEKAVGLNVGDTGYKLTWDSDGGNGQAELYTGSTGNGESVNHMPPYLVVFMWQRVS